jgi:hypothetical protein
MKYLSVTSGVIFFGVLAVITMFVYDTSLVWPLVYWWSGLIFVSIICDLVLRFKF